MTVVDLSTGEVTKAIVNVRVDMIRVGLRTRRDFGDIGALADDIAEHGLINPLLLTPDRLLICGGRRLEALKALGWETAPCILRPVSELVLLELEDSENKHTKPWTIEERTRMAMRIEDQLKAETAERRRNGEIGGRGNSVPIGTEFPPRSDVAAAKAVGLTKSSYDRAKRTLGALDDAQRTGNSDAVAAVSEAIDEMNATGKIAPAFQKAIAAAPPRKPGLPVGQAKVRRHFDQFMAQIVHLNANADGVEFPEDLTQEEAGQLENQLARSISGITRLRNRLKEITT